MSQPSTAFPAELPRHIDSTMISCFRSCPRKFYYEFVLGLRPTALSVDLHAGACFAHAIESINLAVHRDGISLDGAMMKGYAEFMNEWGDFVPTKETSKTPDRIWEAVEEYFKMWPPHTDPVQPYRDTKGNPTFEFTFAIPLEHAEWTVDPVGQNNAILAGAFPLHPSGDPFLYSGRLDALGSYGGKPVGRDEKTTTSIGASWADKWDLRSQFTGYCWALQQSGIPIDTIFVRGVGILKTKISLAEAQKTYEDFKIARWYEQLRRDLWRMRRMWDEGYFDYDLADACVAYGGCAFTPVCTSAKPENWYNSYTVRRWDPLRKNPIGQAVAA